MKPMFGWKAAKWAQGALPQLKAFVLPVLRQGNVQAGGAAEGRADAVDAGAGKIVAWPEGRSDKR